MLEIPSVCLHGTRRDDRNRDWKDLPGDIESCTPQNLPEGWIVCPSRSRDNECSYFCPPFDFTIQWLPRTHCIFAEADGRVAGFLPNLEFHVMPERDQFPIFNGGKPKTEKELALLLPEMLATGKRYINAYYQHAFGYQEGVGHIQNVGWPMMRVGGEKIEIRPNKEQEIVVSGAKEPANSLHVDLNYDKDSRQPLAFGGVDPLSPHGHWQIFESNFWVSIRFPNAQPMVLLNVDAGSVCKKDDDKGMYKIPPAKMDGAKETVVFSSAQLKPWQPLAFGALQLFHGKLGDEKEVDTRVSLDIRFICDYALVLKAATESGDPVHLQNFFYYSRAPSFLNCLDCVKSDFPEVVESDDELDLNNFFK